MTDGGRTIFMHFRSLLRRTNKSRPGRAPGRQLDVERALVHVLCAALIAVLSACGASRKASKPESCVILGNGNKLCGPDAKAYCEKFLKGSTDKTTMRACAAVGVKQPEGPLPESE